MNNYFKPNSGISYKHKSIDMSTLLCYNITEEVILLAFSYKPLWKLLIDKDMSKKELMNRAGISKSTMDKMGRGEMVSMEIIDRICNCLNCPVEEVLGHIKENR